MPKRIATPPMAEEADFYTVNQPYPLNFEWDSKQDVVDLARWVAACLGSASAFWAFYYKPSVSVDPLHCFPSVDTSGSFPGPRQDYP
jgi:hypothetical protein